MTQNEEIRTLFRVARRPDPLAFPERAFVGYGRFDAPDGEFRTLYTAERLYTCFLELLAGFRLDPALLARMAQTTGSDEPLPRSEVPRDWLASRLIGRLHLLPGQSWLDLRALEIREMLRGELASVLVQLGLPDLDVGAARGPSRRLTQEIARWAKGHGYSGIVHTSRLVDDLSCWAIFDHAQFELVSGVEEIRLNNADLVAAAQDLSLTLPKL